MKKSDPVSVGFKATSKLNGLSQAMEEPLHQHDVVPQVQRGLDARVLKWLG